MMRSFVSVICCLLVTFPITGVPTGAQQNSSPAAPDQAPLAACKGPCLEDGTPVKLRIAQTVSSADAHVNDRVEFEVLEEIKIQGVLIVPKGGIALGTRPTRLVITSSDCDKSRKSREKPGGK